MLWAYIRVFQKFPKRKLGRFALWCALKTPVNGKPISAVHPPSTLADLKVVARFVRGRASPAELDEVLTSLKKKWISTPTVEQHADVAAYAAYATARAATTPDGIVSAVTIEARKIVEISKTPEDAAVTRKALAAALRRIFGNPFKGVTIE
jgi:hypothetical protein